METEEKLLETLKCWRFLAKQLERLTNTMEEQEYRITPTLSDTKVFMVGLASSQVENFCFSRMEITDQIDSIKRKMNMCKKAYQTANLTEEEKTTIRYTCSGKSLRELAQNKGMAQARIYRIRNRAVKKMFAEIQNERKKR